MEIKALRLFAKKEHERLVSHYNIDRSKVKYTMFAKLVEEVGEFSQALLASDKLQRGDKLREDKINLDEELADIILVCFMLSQELDINTEKALKEKIEKIKKRNYK